MKVGFLVRFPRLTRKWFWRILISNGYPMCDQNFDVFSKLSWEGKFTLLWTTTHLHCIHFKNRGWLVRSLLTSSVCHCHQQNYDKYLTVQHLDCLIEIERIDHKHTFLSFIIRNDSFGVNVFVYDVVPMMFHSIRYSFTPDRKKQVIQKRVCTESEFYCWFV